MPPPTCTQPQEPTEVKHRYRRSEVLRMTGLSRSQLDYWTRLRLIEPRTRALGRSYGFTDLVTLEKIKRLVSKQVPARRLRRAILALQAGLGQLPAPISQLRVVRNGREIVVTPPEPHGRPIEPFTGQLVLDFESLSARKRIHRMGSRSAEEWFEIGLASDSTPETLEKAAEAYQRAMDSAPEWIEARINLGTTLYQLQRMEEASRVFVGAAQMDPANPLAHFNLGCVLEQLGEVEAAIRSFLRAVELAPSLADAHLNLALAYDSRGEKHLARKHLSLYLQYEPRGAWADFARSRMEEPRAPVHSGKLTIFRQMV